MELLAPSALLALPALAGLIILLYLLKLRRREAVVPSVFLWRRAVQDVQANAPFQRLRRNLLLVLQLTALTAVLAGLAAPYVLARRLGGRNSIIVLDASGSMQATDVGGSRFEQARQRALQIAKAMGRRDEGALVVCAARAWVALPFSRDRRRLVAALARAEPTDCATNMRDGLLLALSLAHKRPKTRVYIISDGAFPALPEVPSSAEVRFVGVGRRNDNVALLACEAARAPLAREHQLFLRVHNYAGQPKRCVVSVYQEDDLLDAQELVLAAGQSRVETYKLALAEKGLLRAELDVEDDLSADNVGYTFAEPASATTVLLVTPGNLFLEQGLLVLPEVTLSKAASLSAEEAALAYKKYDVVVFDGVPPPRPPAAGGVLLIAAESGGEPATLGAQLSSPVIGTWEQQHPALRYVNLSAVQISRARALQPSAGAKVLARAGDHPLIVALEKEDLRVLEFGWNLLDSDLPLRVGFPVLLSNSIRWLAGSGGRAKPTSVRPGTVMRFAAPPGASQGEVNLRNGQRRPLQVVDGRISFAQADHVGVYSMKAGAMEWRWAVDLRNADESDLSPRNELKLGERKVQAGVGPPKVEQHLWPYLILLALAVLLGEWHLYHRRY